MRYFDTGVLLKLHLPQSRAADAVAFVNANPCKPPVNHLHELKMHSALRQKAGRGELTQTECDALIAQVESDLTTGVHEAARLKPGRAHVLMTVESVEMEEKPLLRNLTPPHPG